MLQILGIDGDKAWREGASWQKYLRNWRGLVKPETRLKDLALNLQLHEESDKIKADKVITGHASSPKQYEPNKVIDRIGRNNKVETRTFYDEKGMKLKDITNHDHDNPKKHPFGKNGEHAHDYTWSEDGSVLIEKTKRDLNGYGRKENSDIL